MSPAQLTPSSIPHNHLTSNIAQPANQVPLLRLCRNCSYANVSHPLFRRYTNAATQTSSGSESFCSFCGDLLSRNNDSGFQSPAGREDGRRVQAGVASETSVYPSLSQQDSLGAESVPEATVQLSTRSPLTEGWWVSPSPSLPRRLPEHISWRYAGYWRSREEEEDEVDAYETDPEESQVAWVPELPDVHMMQAQVMATSASWNEATPGVFFLGDEMDTSSDGGNDATATDMTTTSFACTYPVEMEGVVAGSLAETTSFMSTEPLASIPFSYANNYLPDWTPAAEEAYSFENVQSIPLEQSGRCGRTDREPASGRPVPGWEINHQDVVRERRRGGEDEGESEDERPKRQRDKFPRFEPEEFEGTMDVSVARHRLRVLDDFDALVSTFDYTDGSDQSDHEADDVSTGSPPYSPTLGPVAGSSCPDSSEPARVHEPRSAAAVAVPQPLPHPVPILADRLCSTAIQSRTGHERNDDQASRDVVRLRRDRDSRRNRGLRRLGRPATATRVQRVSRTGGRNSMVRGQGMLSAVVQYLQRKQQNEDTAAHDSDGSDDGEMGDDEDEQGDVAADVGYRQQTLSQRQYDPSWMVRDNADESEQEYDPGAGDLDY